jgi:valyl-tRNA synthetase
LINYAVNYDYIVKNLCENRNIPQSTCKGKCYVEKELAKTTVDYQKYVSRMNNENFMKNAPENVRAEVIDGERTLKEKIQSIEENLIQFKN